VRRLQPRAFIVENVKGLTRESFANYFSYITLQLEFPEIVVREEEAWEAHLRRLQREKTSGIRRGLTYNVVSQLLNAADFGVPQKRERIFIVGFRSDLEIRWAFPQPTHSNESLLTEKWVTGNYWARHRVTPRERGDIPIHLRRSTSVARQRNLRPTDELKPWRTVRDALRGLPDPELYPQEACTILDHRFQPGVRFYAGHSGSPLDHPAKTLKAGDHGVPGGENALVRPDGTGRYFTIRESARLQGFPDAYKFHGSWTEAMRQLGNAVPVPLGHVVGASVARQLLALDMVKSAELVGQV
jgi:DNA (cytosine-5)-methyltransferase 1